MKENLVPCLELGSRPECESCSDKDRPLPLNWPENVSLPCIIEVQQSIEKAEAILGAKIKMMRNERNRLLNEGIRHGDLDASIF